MTVKLTQKLINNQNRGRKSNIDAAAKQLSIETLQLSGTLIPGGKKKLDASALTDVDEEEAEKKGAEEPKGPPGFYDDDFAKYLKKFDKSVKDR